MRKELLIFGANGALGQGVTKVLSQKDFDKIYTFDSHIAEETIPNNKLVKIRIKDLTKEENVIEAFSNIKPNKDTCFFLFSAIGGYWGGESIWETKSEDWNRIIEIKFKYQLFPCQAFFVVGKSISGRFNLHNSSIYSRKS